jgi:beta-lactamase regulating signal transducer with metallopeptidase domain
MKHITKLSNNRYIHLDSYGEYRESPLSKLVMTTFVLVIAAITAGAMVGIDITNINRAPTQQQTK